MPCHHLSKQFPMKKISINAILIFWLSVCAAQKGDFVADPYRPSYHISPPEGWMGDPSGLVYENGLYHFHYWRHITSKDLVHWTQHPRAFARIDSIGQMSGSVVFDKYNTSGFGTKENPAFVAIYSMLRHRDAMQMQGLAYSVDKGETYTHYKGNPVLDIGSTEFRDPQVFWYAPGNKWVMIIALADKRQVSFYSSANLKEWKHLSDFGPVGAQGGVWECPDIFQLPVDGNMHHKKWVLEVDVQPVGGQYFIGDFDGEKFAMDTAFAKRLNKPSYMPAGDLLFDFENGLDGWKIEGDAFNASPSKGALDLQSVIIGYQGKQLVNSFYKGDKTTGRIISPPFTINKNYINFLIGGGYHPDSVAINLIVNGKVVRTATGVNTETMRWNNWPVNDLKGKTASIGIIDLYTSDFGHINIDHIMQADSPATYQREYAPWIDYGMDYYAVRSWQDAPQNDTGRVWIAWMGNWLYAKDLPTTKWKGMQSVPRILGLKAFDDGIKLIQNPVAGLQQLRYDHVSSSPGTVTGLRQLTTFTPTNNSYELDIVFELGTAKEFGLQVAAGATNKTIIAYDVAKRQLSVDRTQSGKVKFNPSFPQATSAALDAVNNTIRLHLMVDQCSLEVFGNDGETVISNLIFPEKGDTAIRLFSNGGSVKVKSLNAWKLRSATN